MLAATVNASIVIIALPAIFRGIHLNPLTPGNVSYLLWMLMGYLVVSAVLVVTLGRLGRHLRPGPHVQPGLHDVRVSARSRSRSTRSPGPAARSG